MRTTADLSLEQAPPIAVPFRFFLTAPVFGMATGVLLLWVGPEALSGRWTASALAITHLFTLGFLAMVMCGAALQVLPVLAGVPVPGVRWVGPSVHLLLVGGATCLAAGFLGAPGWTLQVGPLALGLGFALFLAAVGLALARVERFSATVTGIGAAMLALAVTVALGLYLAGGVSGWWVAPGAARVTDLHLGWGLLGWVGLLVVAVAWQVVPLFQITPEYPARLRRWLMPVVLCALAGWSLGVVWDGGSGAVARVSALAATGGYLVFAGTTLRLQARRRRRVSDLTLLFWRTAMLAVFATFLVWAAALAMPWLAGLPAVPLLLGLWLMAGVALSVTNGMLYKIVPFLAWFHLQQRQVALLAHGYVEIPHMKALLPDVPARRQLWLHWAVLALGTGAVLRPDLLARPWGLALVLSFGVLWINLGGAALRYRQANRRLRGATAG